MTASVPDESKQGVTPPQRRRFPRFGRLLRHADFEHVYKQGRRHFSASMTVFYLQRQSMGSKEGLRVGFTVGRALGGAVQRNRTKRRLREAVRLTCPRPGPAVDVVINPKKAVLAAGFDTLVNEVRQAFVVIDRKLAAAPTDSRKRGGGSPKPEA